MSGSPTLSQLLEAWQEIIDEYVSLIKTEKANDVFALYKKIRFTEWLMNFIERCVKALKHQYDADIAALLEERGYGAVVHSTDRATYLKSVYAIETSAKTLIVLLNQYNAEYESIQKEQIETEDHQSESEKRFRYEKELALLSKYQGERIIKEKITVLEYAAIINNYLEEQRKKKIVEDHGRK